MSFGNFRAFRIGGYYALFHAKKCLRSDTDHVICTVNQVGRRFESKHVAHVSPLMMSASLRLVLWALIGLIVACLLASASSYRSDFFGSFQVLVFPSYKIKIGIVEGCFRMLCHRILYMIHERIYLNCIGFTPDTQKVVNTQDQIPTSSKRVHQQKAVDV